MSDPQQPGSNEPLDTGHDYDGIREYDNKLPNWWLATLFLAIIFGFGYWTYYHVMQSGSPSQKEYRAEMKEAAERAEALAKSRGAVTDELLVAMSTNPDRIEAGGAVFKKTCVVCHGAQGQGLIGPNLTDDYWLHGSHPTQILKTITGGVPDKGMPSWGPVLGEDTVEAVAAYVLTLKGKHIAGKAPQGVIETASNDLTPPVAPK